MCVVCCKFRYGLRVRILSLRLSPLRFDCLLCVRLCVACCCLLRLRVFFFCCVVCSLLLSVIVWVCRFMLFYVGCCLVVFSLFNG